MQLPTEQGQACAVVDVRPRPGLSRPPVPAGSSVLAGVGPVVVEAFEQLVGEVHGGEVDRPCGHFHQGPELGRIEEGAPGVAGDVGEAEVLIGLCQGQDVRPWWTRKRYSSCQGVGVVMRARAAMSVARVRRRYGSGQVSRTKRAAQRWATDWNWSQASLRA